MHTDRCHWKNYHATLQEVNIVFIINDNDDVVIVSLQLALSVCSMPRFLVLNQELFLQGQPFTCKAWKSQGIQKTVEQVKLWKGVSLKKLVVDGVVVSFLDD